MNGKSLVGKQLMSITRMLFVSTQVCAIVWVSLSYLMAIYATIVLSQPFPVEELSKTAIEALLGNGALKTISNIFEHNNGSFLGTSRGSEDE